MGYIKNSRRVELALIPRMYRRWYMSAMDAVVKSGRSPNSADKQVLDDLLASENEAYAGIDDKDRIAVQRRVDRVQNDILAPYETGSMGRIWLQLGFLFSDLRDGGYVSMHDGSAIDRAYHAMLDSIYANESVVVPMEHAATKGAAKMLKSLRKMGFYR